MNQLTETEFAALLTACRAVPPAQGNYLIDDFVENLLLTVIDFQMNTKAVERAMEYFNKHNGGSVSDIADLKMILDRFMDDKQGNLELAQHLWGYNLWTRAEMLRKLVFFFEDNGVVNQNTLRIWAETAQFSTHFQGKVKGLGIAVFHWLILRQGVDTVKPDVHIHRFIERSIGRKLSDEDAIACIVRAAQALGLPAYKLDWAIWEQGRAS